LKINGFCVSFIGSSNIIHIGWYLNSLKNGNWMAVNGNSFKVIESGWYENGMLIDEM